MTSRLLLAAPLALLGACAEPPSPTPDQAPEGFGLSVRHNIEAQLAHPDRAFETLGPAPGNRRALSVERYQVDEVEPPVKVFTRSE